MAVSNPLAVLSYVGGPALLTNCTALFVLSTSNRFARAVDRSRLVADRLSRERAQRPHLREEMPEVQHRVLLIGRALVCFYLAAAAFAVATLSSIAAALLSPALQGIPIPLGISLIAGATGFCAFIGGAGILVLESRVAVRSLSRECNEALWRAKQQKTI